MKFIKIALLLNFFFLTQFTFANLESDLQATLTEPTPDKVVRFVNDHLFEKEANAAIGAYRASLRSQKSLWGKMSLALRRQSPLTDSGQLLSPLHSISYKARMLEKMKDINARIAARLRNPDATEKKLSLKELKDFEQFEKVHDLIAKFIEKHELVLSSMPQLQELHEVASQSHTLYQVIQQKNSGTKWTKKWRFNRI